MAVQQPNEAVAVESYLNAYEHAIKIIKQREQQKNSPAQELVDYPVDAINYGDPFHPDDPDYDNIFTSPRI